MLVARRWYKLAGVEACGKQVDPRSVLAGKAPQSLELVLVDGLQSRQVPQVCKSRRNVMAGRYGARLDLFGGDRRSKKLQ